MLTKDVLTKNLEGLSDEQINTIVELSQNDENQVLAKKIGEVHSQYDKDVENITGEKKKADEKTYDFVKRVLKTDQQKSEELANKIKDYEQQIKDLKKNQNTGDDQKLKDTQDKLDNLQKEYDKVKNQLKEKDNEIKDAKINFHLDSALSNVKLKSSIPESAKQVLTKDAKEKLKKEYKTEFDENGELIFRDKDGNLLTNPDNKMQPFKASEMIQRTLKNMEVLDDDNSGKKGNGSEGSAGKGNDTTIANAKNQVEADEMIGDELAKQGYSKGTQEYADKQAELREQYKVSELPMRNE